MNNSDRLDVDLIDSFNLNEEEERDDCKEGNGKEMIVVFDGIAVILFYEFWVLIDREDGGVVVVPG